MPLELALGLADYAYVLDWRRIALEGSSTAVRKEPKRLHVLAPSLHQGRSSSFVGECQQARASDRGWRFEVRLIEQGLVHGSSDVHPRSLGDQLDGVARMGWSWGSAIRPGALQSRTDASEQGILVKRLAQVANNALP
jgi:hypothetical protein